MKNSTRIKIGKNYRITFAVYGAMLFTICAELIGGIVCAIHTDINDFVMIQFVVLGFIGLCALGYIISEFVSRDICTVEKDEITICKDNKILFKIKMSDIKSLVYKKPTIPMRLLFLPGIIVGIPLVGLLSIRYYTAEIVEQPNRYGRGPIITLEDYERQSGLKEYVLMLGKKEIKKIMDVSSKSISYI